MKAIELVKKLNKLIEKHGDIEVLAMYDSNGPGYGCLRKPDRAHYYKKIEWNAYSDYSNTVENVIVLE